jgi:DNA polymerase-3 subunit delta'
MSFFEGVRGQERAVALLEADLASGRVADTYLFLGPKGSGRMAAALAFAKGLNCSSADAAGEESAGFLLDAPSAAPKAASPSCAGCPSCRKVDAGTHPDVFVLNFDSQARMLDLKDDEKARQKEIRIETVRQLISQSHKTPLEGKSKVFIIEDAELLNEESANALLKVLEESPSQSRWILLAVSLERIIPTIQSRSRKVAFSPPAGAPSGKEPEPTGIESLIDGEIAPFAFSSQVMAGAKKGSQRKYAEQVLRQAALEMSARLRRDPRLQVADQLALILQSQDELRRNVSPQLVMDSLALALARSPEAVR